MKHIAILLIICTLSGCGLFKKTSMEIDKHVEKIEHSSDKQTNIDHLDNSKSIEVNTSVSSELTVNGYKVTADAIKFNTDGSFDAKGNVSMTGNSEWKREKQDSTSKEVQSDVKVKESTTEKVKQVHEVKDYSKQTKSETDFWGIIAGAIGVLGLALGLIWYLKK